MTGKTDDIVVFLLRAPKEQVWDLSEHTEKKSRSKNANSYFHRLCRLIAEAQGLSEPFVKNEMISDYGQVSMIGDDVEVYKTITPEHIMMNRELPHVKCFRITIENNKTIFWYRIYRGSHTYDSKEMARLIDGTIQEARNCGIPEKEILSPNEVAKLIAKWGDAYEQTKSKDAAGAD